MIVKSALKTCDLRFVVWYYNHGVATVGKSAVGRSAKADRMRTWRQPEGPKTELIHDMTVTIVHQITLEISQSKTTSLGRVHSWQTSALYLQILAQGGGGYVSF